VDLWTPRPLLGSPGLWRQRYAGADGRIEFGIILAVILALALMGSMLWMVITGNMFCCDPKSLVGQLFKLF